MNQLRDLEDDSLTDWEPVQLPQQWYGLVTPMGARHQARCSILYKLPEAK